MNERDRAREKIGKLLALANRPGTPEEGEAALLRAQALADRHGFTIRKRQPPRIRTERITVDMSDWLRDYLFKTDRGDVEDQVRRDQQELKRKRTRINNVRQRGYDAYHAGTHHVYNPFKNGTTFGVNQRREWRRGWENARHGRNPTD